MPLIACVSSPRLAPTLPKIKREGPPNCEQEREQQVRQLALSAACVGLPQVCTQRRRRSDRRSLVRPSLPSPLLNHGEGAPNLILPSSSPKKMLPATTTEATMFEGGEPALGLVWAAQSHPVVGVAAAAARSTAQTARGPTQTCLNYTAITRSEMEMKKFLEGGGEEEAAP